MMRAIIGAGANLGSREATLRAAWLRVFDHPEIFGMRISRLFETEPVGPEQPRYLNCAASLCTTLELRALLEWLQQVEHELGRTRETPLGPRTLDLDILHATTSANEDGLVVPHPRLHERAFALVPLLSIAPELEELRTDAANVDAGWGAFEPAKLTRHAGGLRVSASTRADALALGLTEYWGSHATIEEIVTLSAGTLEEVVESIARTSRAIRNVTLHPSGTLFVPRIAVGPSQPLTAPVRKWSAEPRRVLVDLFSPDGNGS